MLIEDDEAYQLAMASHLRQLPDVQTLLVASDGEQGLELIEGRSVDLVPLDLVLPGFTVGGGQLVGSEGDGRVAASQFPSAQRCIARE